MKKIVFKSLSHQSEERMFSCSDLMCIKKGKRCMMVNSAIVYITVVNSSEIEKMGWRRNGINKKKYKWKDSRQVLKMKKRLKHASSSSTVIIMMKIIITT